MGVVLAALVPVFLLIVLGFALKQSLMRLETQWHGLERLVYYVLLPALLIDTLRVPTSPRFRCSASAAR